MSDFTKTFTKYKQQLADATKAKQNIGQNTEVFIEGLVAGDCFKLLKVITESQSVSLIVKVNTIDTTGGMTNITYCGYEIIENGGTIQSIKLIPEGTLNKLQIAEYTEIEIFGSDNKFLDNFIGPLASVFEGCNPITILKPAKQ